MIFARRFLTIYRSKHIVPRLYESIFICWSIVGHFQVIMHFLKQLFLPLMVIYLGFFIATCSSLIGDLILVEFELWNSLFACTSLIITTYCLHSQNRCLDTLFMLIRCGFYFQFLHNDTKNSSHDLCFHTYMTLLGENKIDMNDWQFADWTRI